MLCECEHFDTQKLYILLYFCLSLITAVVQFTNYQISWSLSGKNIECRFKDNVIFKDFSYDTL